MKLRSQSLILLMLLGLQFVLGMILNLFVTLPRGHAGTTGGYLSRASHSFIWAISSGGGVVLVLHVLVAIALAIGSLALLIRAISRANSAWITASLVAAVGVLAALTNGLAFLGYNNNINSFVMAMGFMVAATAYSVALTFAEVPSTKRTKKEVEASHHHLPGRYRPSHS